MKRKSWQEKRTLRGKRETRGKTKENGDFSERKKGPFWREEREEKLVHVMHTTCSVFEQFHHPFHPWTSPLTHFPHFLSLPVALLNTNPYSHGYLYFTTSLICLHHAWTPTYISPQVIPLIHLHTHRIHTHFFSILHTHQIQPRLLTSKIRSGFL